MEQVGELKRTWNLAPVLHLVQMIPESYYPCFYLSIGQVWWLNELWIRIYIQKCTLSRVLIILIILIYLVNHEVVKNGKTWISWKRNTNFLWNKKILDLCFRWNILRNCHFVAEVTFKIKHLLNRSNMKLGKTIVDNSSIAPMLKM